MNTNRLIKVLMLIYDGNGIGSERFIYRMISSFRAPLFCHHDISPEIVISLGGRAGETCSLE